MKKGNSLIYVAIIALAVAVTAVTLTRPRTVVVPGDNVVNEIMRDSLDILGMQRDSLLARIDSLECLIFRSQFRADSLLSEIRLNREKYEKMVFDMLRWSDDQHIRFFADQTAPD